MIGHGLTWAQQKAMIFFRDRGPTDNPQARGPGMRVRKNLEALGLIEAIPDAPRLCFRLTESGRALVEHWPQ